MDLENTGCFEMYSSTFMLHSSANIKVLFEKYSVPISLSVLARISLHVALSFRIPFGSFSFALDEREDCDL